MAGRAAKLEEAERLVRKAGKLWSPSIFELRLKPDWGASAPLFERAALAFKQAGELEQARDAYEKAAQCQERMGSAWHAAKHLEAASQAARELGSWPAAAAAARHAAEQYAQAGRPAAGADALARLARQLEDVALAEACGLYEAALLLYETADEGGRGGAQAGDAFRQAAAALARAGRHADAATVLARFAAASGAAGAKSSQCKAYLSAVVCLLSAARARDAWAAYQDAMAVDAFAASEEAFAADALFSAYASGGGGAEAVRAVVSGKPIFRHLDTAMGKLALKLPAGEFEPQAREISALMGEGGGGGYGGGGDKDSDDELM